MARRLPSRSDPDVDAVPRVVGLDDAAENLLSALSSATTRRLLAALHD